MFESLAHLKMVLTKRRYLKNDVSTVRHSEAEVSLSELVPGQRAVVSGLQTDGDIYRRLLDLGVVIGTDIEAVFSSPSGDPVVYQVRGTQIALRKRDADLVKVQFGPPESAAPQRHCQTYLCGACTVKHSRVSADLIKSDFVVALAGNPNTGKSTVFNALTGLRQHVGNWPGKTVMRAEGRYRYRDARFDIVDLPGTYSLLSTSQEEEIARDYILFDAPDCTVIVADATCLNRNLNLVAQILQITSRAVVCVNLLDEAERKGITVDTDALSRRLGVPVVGTAARRGHGLEALRETIYGVARGEIETNPMMLRYDSALENAIEKIVPEVKRALPNVPNSRWIALRLLDGGDKGLTAAIKTGALESRKPSHE